MKVGIIGAGKVGCSFAIALMQKGFRISEIYSRNAQEVQLFADKMCQCFSNDLYQLLETSDLILVTVTDSNISNVAEMIAALDDAPSLEGKVFLHCSGALTSCELMALASLGAETGSLHPVQTFADKENSWRGLEGIYYGFEGSSGALQYAQEIVSIFNGTLLHIKPAAKKLYHAAACVISNYTVSLSYAACKLLEQAGIDGQAGIKALMPLLRNTVENIDNMGVAAALTGPISRGDINTVAEHINAMGTDNSNVLELYKSAGRLAMEIALNKGSIDLVKANEIQLLLADK